MPVLGSHFGFMRCYSSATFLVSHGDCFITLIRFGLRSAVLQYFVRWFTGLRFPFAIRFVTVYRLVTLRLVLVRSGSAGLVLVYVYPLVTTFG